MAAKDYIDPKGYWGDPEGNIHRMGNEDGEQEIIATVAKTCSETEWKALCRTMDNAALKSRASR
jgi:hypothetical protein